MISIIKSVLRSVDYPISKQLLAVLVLLNSTTSPTTWASTMTWRNKNLTAATRCSTTSSPGSGKLARSSRRSRTPRTIPRPRKKVTDEKQRRCR
jgi:hypothetical protein